MSSDSGLPSLATELLSLIFELLSISDLKNLRLTNSGLVNIAAKFLFHDINVLFNTKSLERLVEISSHPYISSCVKALIYEADRLDQICDRSTWHLVLQGTGFRAQVAQASKARKWGNFFRPCFWDKPSNEPTIDVAFWRHKELLRDQEDVKRTYHDRFLLTKSLSRLPNLHQIIFSTRELHFPFTPYYRRTYGPGYVISGTEPGDWLGVHACTSLLKSLTPRTNATAANLKDLRIGYVHWHILRNLLVPNFLDGIKGLTTLSLDIAVPGNQWISERDQIRACRQYIQGPDTPLYSLLSGLRNLRSLRIRFVTHLWFDRPSNIVCKLENIFGYTQQALRQQNVINGSPITFKRLDHLSLINIGLSCTTLRRLLHHHQDSLTSIHLQHIAIEPAEKWEDMLVTMRDCGIKWREVEICGYLGNGAWRAETTQRVKSGSPAARVIRDIVMETHEGGKARPIREEMEKIALV
ncbi:MAG: hypothetical protein Q9227_002885 [Pyrenula ochraceoflavens]